MTSPRSRRLAAGLWSLLPFALLLLGAAIWSTHPAVVPTHWMLGTDGFSTGPGAFLLAVAVSGFTGIMTALVGLFSSLLPPAWSRWLMILLAGVGAGAAAMYGAAALGTHLAGGDPRAVSGLWALATPVAVLVWIVVAHRLTRVELPPRAEVLETVPERARVAPATSATAATPTEPIRWETTVRSSVLVGNLVVVVLAMGVSTYLVGRDSLGRGLSVALLGLALAGFVAAWAHITVRVDGDGMTFRSALAPVTLKHIPAAEVLGVEVSDLDPMKWGGQGLRWLSDRTSYIATGGPGIVIYRASGRRFAVETTEGEEVARAGAAALRAAAGSHQFS